LPWLPLQELLFSENTCAFTMNRREFEVLCSATLRQLKEACTQSEASTATGTQGNANNARGTHNRHASSVATFHKQPSSTGMGPADASNPGMFSEIARDHVLTMIAVSLTYFKMSSRRVVDGVPMLIMHHLLGR
jgi:hypothetical protein